MLITRPNKKITFEANEPIAIVVPQRKQELEQFDPSVHELEVNIDKEQAYYDWAANRIKVTENHGETKVDVRDFKGLFNMQVDGIEKKLNSFRS